MTEPNMTQVQIRFPQPITELTATASDAASSESGFNVEASGSGTFTGLAYSIPAHTRGKIKVSINVKALTTGDLADLNKSIMALLDASKQSSVEEHSKTTGHADLSLWDFLGLGGGASAGATYENTKDSMQSMGLSQDQIDTIIDDFFEIAKKMNHVRLDLTVDNTANDYSVDGDLQLYTMSGEIKTSKGTTQYRLLASEGSAGSAGQEAPAKGNVIPLS